MIDGFWTWVEERKIGGHQLALITRTIDGFQQWEVVADCIAQFHGGEMEARREFRKWARQLAANDRARKARQLHSPIGGRDGRAETPKSKGETLAG
jgi:hypothetical protein